MEWDVLREQLIEDFYPEDQELEEIREKYREIGNFIRKEFGMETHFAGSASRHTCMKGDKDIDIFVLFPRDTEEHKLEEKGLEIGKAVFEEFNGDYEIDYAEHPYTKGQIRDHEVEIVPCIDTTPDDIQSSVDRTPHHSRWVGKNLSEREKKDVVLLKRFLKSNGLYGSSLKVRGFSGYICEILISHYGSFQKLIRNAVDWEHQEVIDTANHHEGSLPGKLSEKFKEENLIVIDPVDPERNAASVLSKQNFSKFIFLCWKFRNDPDRRFFEDGSEEYSEFEIKQELNRRKDFMTVEFQRPEEVDDIIYPQMRKTLRIIQRELEQKGFRTFESGFFVGDRIKIYFEIEGNLPEVEEKKGPKVFHGEDHIAQFCSKYDNVYIGEDRLVAKVEREFTEARNLVKEFLSDELHEKGIPKKIADELNDFRFKDPLEGEREWINHLGEQLHIKHDD